MAALSTFAVVADGVLVFDVYGTGGEPSVSVGTGDPFANFIVYNSPFSNFFTFTVYGSSGESAVADEVVKTGTGGIDPSGRGRGIVKPTGIEQRRPTLHLPKKSPTPTERIEDSRSLQAEVAAKLATEFAADNEARASEIVVPISTMPLADIEAEIARLLRKKLRTQEDEIMLLVLMAAAA